MIYYYCGLAVFRLGYFLINVRKGRIWFLLCCTLVFCTTGCGLHRYWQILARYPEKYNNHGWIFKSHTLHNSLTGTLLTQSQSFWLRYNEVYSICTTQRTPIPLCIRKFDGKKNNELKTWIGSIDWSSTRPAVFLSQCWHGASWGVETSENILHLIVLFWEMWQKFSVVVWTKFYDL